jgi:bifunctional enzyme CysN/CysC
MSSGIDMEGTLDNVDRQGQHTRGVIWITGYSGAGKTTVARKVQHRLRENGVRTVLLDGDDLRAIFGGRWSYDRDQRTELARVYFRLCSHLSSQGMTVIISAVAMFSEVRTWVRSNIPGAMQVYLRVPEDERRRRDSVTKQVYSQAGRAPDLYDEPLDADLTIDNFGATGPDEVAAAIVDAFLRGVNQDSADLGRAAHWQSFYTTAKGTLEPSPFARTVAERLPRNARLLEVGCGNGRDSVFFASLGCDVTAIDVSPSAITLCRTTHDDTRVDFRAGALSDVIESLASGYDAVYSRFCLHAMTRGEEQATLDGAAQLLKPGGALFIECRSINDSLARQGEVISPTERIHGHYRRFIVMDDLVDSVESVGLRVLERIESQGFARFEDEDPMVIRLLAQKP